MKYYSLVSIFKFGPLEFKMLGLVAQTIQITIQIGVKWIAQTPPKRQVEGSNPSEPAPISVLFSGFHK
jgi:hypothetical protein